MHTWTIAAYCQSSSKKDSREKNNFTEAMKHIQGHHSIPFDMHQMIMTLDEYFESLGMQTSEELKKNELLPSGIRKGTSRQILLDALYALKLGRYQAHINIIAREYWDWRLPNFVNLQSKINEDCKSFNGVYPEFNEGRESFINSFWLIHRILNDRYALVFDPQFFKVVKTTETCAQYSRIYKNCSDDLEWNTNSGN